MSKKTDGGNGRVPRARRFAGFVLMIGGVVALIGSYAWYVLWRIESFSARDLRALSTLAAQIESEVDGHAQTVLDVAATGPAGDLLTELRPTAYADFIDLKSEPAARSDMREGLTFTLRTAAPKPHLEIHSFDRKTNTQAVGAIPIDNYVHPFFEQSFLGVFEVLLLTTTAGKVLAQSPTTSQPPLPPLLNARNHHHPDSRVADGVVVKELGALERRDGFRSWSPLNVRELRGASRRTEVRINETEYYLFTQPVRFHFERGETIATNAMAPDSEDSDLLVGALIRKPKLRRQAMAISDSLVLIGIAILILLACSFPFSRIVALPKGAPLRAVDVVLAAVAAVVASAVLTVTISDAVTYRRMYSLENDLLARYANNLRRDILRDLMRSAVAAEALRTSSSARSGTVDNYRVDWTNEHLFQQPYFESLLWADLKGNTIATAAMRGKAPPKTSVERRSFFSDVINNNWWTVVERKEGKDLSHEVVVEVVPSRYDPLTIVAVPSLNPEHVFAAYIRFIHFIDPVVPPGFGFAVIDDQGVVQFHSDKHRALHENFFKETEDDRQLRAAVYARRDAQINARYWGNDYQLYVAPVPGTTWTIITMREELLLRSINSEIVALTTLLLALYAAVYAAAFVFLAAVNPRYRAPWLWPNHEGSWEYITAIIALLIDVIAFTACVLYLDSWEVLYVAFLAPLRGLCTAFILTTTDPKERKQRGIGILIWILITGFWIWVVATASLAPIVAESYSRPGTLWLIGLLVAIPLLPMFVNRPPYVEFERTGTFIAYKFSGMLMVVGIAVIPAFAFLQVATRLGTEARIKYSQLILADLLEKRIALLERISMREPRIAFDCYTIPYIFNSAWTVVPRATTPRPMKLGDIQKKRPSGEEHIGLTCREDSAQPAWFPQSISRLLPHYSEGSVALRNLEFNTASDHTWRWCRNPYALLFQKRVQFDAHTAAKLYGAPRPAELLILTPLPMVMHQQQWFAKSPRVADLHCPAPPDSSVGDPAALAGLQNGIVKPSRPAVFDWIRVLFWITGIFLFFYLPFSGVGFMGRHVFLYRVEAPDWQSPRTLQKSVGENLFIVDLAPETVQAPGVQRLTPAIRNRKLWRELRASTDAESPMVDLVLTDFADVFFSDARDELLSFLEDVLGAKRRAVQVFSRVSAATLLEMVSAETCERWKQLFTQFAHIDETASAMPVPKLVKDENRFVFERIWADSSPDERLVMYQLARDGLVNEKNADTLKRLMGRRLVKRSPELELITPGLERFVMTTAKPEQVAAAERETETPRWTSLGIALTVLIIAGMTVIFTSQKDVINYTSGIITAIAAAVPALLKLIAVLSGRAPAENA